LMPWIVALAMKANLISLVTGISHERLNVLHRWAAYTCLVLSILHTVPFYVTPVWERGARMSFEAIFHQQGFYVYGSGMYKSLDKMLLHTGIDLLTRFQESLPSFRSASFAPIQLRLSATECTSYL